MIGPADYYRAEADPAPLGPVVLTPAELRAVGHDDVLKNYWLHGKGLAKWATSPHPWTALYHHLRKHVNPEYAKRIAAQWYHEHFGHWPGERKGKNPIGRG